jgi:VCBS repeat-containing protein
MSRYYNRASYEFGSYRDDEITGSDQSDIIFGFRGDDEIDGGGGKDLVFGGSGDDVVNGGAGSDKVFGGRGDDRLIFDASENEGAKDYYDGGSGRDTLELNLTSEMWFDPAFQTELADFLAQSESSQGGHCYSYRGSSAFKFDTLGLTVRSIEDVTISVDGVSVSAVDDAVIAVDDMNTIGEDDVSVTGNVLENDSVPDLVANISVAQQATYGTVTIDADGAYVFNLDNANADVQALNDGDVITDTFTYTVEDANGDMATATVSITIAGSDDSSYVSLGLWEFSDGAETANTAEGQDNPVQFMNDAFATDGMVHLDGQDDYLLIDHVPAYKVGEGGVRMTFTVDTLTGKAGSNFNSDNFQALFSSDATGLEDGGHVTAFVDGTGSIVVRHQTETESYIARTDIDLFDVGDDVEFVYLFDETDGMQLLVGVNGDPLTLAAQNDQPILDGDFVSLEGNTEPWTIGASQTRSDVGVPNELQTFFDGSIDSFEVFTGEDVFIF